ncbi:bifunctional riboflavin kinase/FMN adenylyltransferase [Erysipelothrix larvae]|uniref:Riboflavin biosynthesis protein n=1 Tax=Erysipelothrix larvae TaxID=1514105 RepID=A0A109UGW6_9FIRM|nr:riboflavin biosynthesis protein RibF [Erysipelothrix larvae]AMC93328.1 bifunctional riboflavin kinase/FMN adenylyltransferase [Erysipelothrix larvae]
MKVIHIDTLDSLSHDFDETAACIGYFDGVHRGHQELIHKTLKVASEKDLKSSFITFHPDPWSVLKESNQVNHITPMVEKTRIVESYGFDMMVVIGFTKDISRLSPQDFIEKLILPLNVKSLICGNDYRFGFKGQGTPAYIQANYADILPCDVIDLLNDEFGKIGSTHIIQKILKGNMEVVTQELGREYCVSGKVIHGRKQGRLIGFPTANMELIGEYVIPKPGVYAGYTRVKENVYISIINIGYNPTFNTTPTLSIETHILDFNDEIYGEVITQSFSVRIRDELKFDGLDGLIDQMNQDAQFAREHLGENLKHVKF